MQDTKSDDLIVPFGLGKNAVFAFAACSETHPMLRQTAEHVLAFTNIDGLIVDSDFINAGVFKLLVPALALQPCINAVFICAFL